jgi:hypothetical protein
MLPTLLLSRHPIVGRVRATLMDFINPVAGSLLQSTAVQRQQSADKQRQVRRAQALQRDVAAQDDQLEHQVESSEELPPVNDEHPEHEQQKKKKRGTDQAGDDEDQPHLDLTA